MSFRWAAGIGGLFLIQAAMACRGSTAPRAVGSADEPSSRESAVAQSPTDASAPVAVPSGAGQAKGPSTVASDAPTTLPPGMVDVVHGPMKDLPAKSTPLSRPACQSLLKRAAASAQAAHVANGRCQADSECVASETGACLGGCYTAVAKAKRKEQEQALGDIQDKLCGPLWAGDCAKHLPPIPIPTCPAPIPKCENGICEARY